jgi:hypothetical protein
MSVACSAWIEIVKRIGSGMFGDPGVRPSPTFTP